MNDRARTVEAFSKLGVGVVAILVLAGLLWANLQKQSEFESAARDRENRDRDRVYELMKRQSSTAHELTREQNKILEELVRTGEIRTQVLQELRVLNQRTGEMTVQAVREELRKVRQDVNFLERKKIDLLKQRPWQDDMEKAQ